MDPSKLKDQQLYEKVKSLKPEFFVVASYGKMIPSDWLKIPSKLCINVHPSLLPKYRGAAPINWPILNGDSETGLSLAEVTEKLDAGDLFYQSSFPITASDDALTLSQKLEDLSRRALEETFLKIHRGEELSRTTQDERNFCYARKLTKEDAQVCWGKTAAEIQRQVRALKPWPGTFSLFQGQPLQILSARVYDPDSSGPSGKVMHVLKQSFTVQAGKGILEILKVKPAGKNEMNAGDFARGKRFEPGFSFEEKLE